MQITIINQQKKIPVNKRAVKTTVLKTLEILSPYTKRFGVGASLGRLTIVYVDNQAIEELNYKFLKKRCPTDVLCFDFSEGKDLNADIVISAEMARENSTLFKTSALWEANLYLVHGILHLFGFDDRSKKQRLRMQRKALRILKSIISS